MPTDNDTTGICIGDLYRSAVSLLDAAGVEEPETDSRLLLESVTGLSRTEMYLRWSEPVSESGVKWFHKLIKRRKLREPVAYILGEREFWSYTFKVSPAVLIPRPETEFLVEQVLRLTDPKNLQGGPLVDLCCGSGAVGIVLSLETGCSVLGLDVSKEALAVASENREALCENRKLYLVQSDLLTAVVPGPELSVIVTNPPYVCRGEIERELLPEVARYEPRLALDGGEDGLDLIKKIRIQAWERLREQGQFFMEFGTEQGRAIEQLFREPYEGIPGFSQVRVYQDYSGRDRVLAAVK